MQPSNLYEYYTSKGQALPSVSDRASVATKAGITEPYTGSETQNKTLLSYLMTSNTPAVVKNQSNIMQDTSSLTSKDSQNSVKLDNLLAPPQTTSSQNGQVLDKNGNVVYNGEVLGPIDKSTSNVGNVTASDGGTYSQSLPEGFNYTLPTPPAGSKYIYGSDGRLYLQDQKGNVTSDPTADQEFQANKEEKRQLDERNTLYDSYKQGLDSSYASLIDGIKAQASSQKTQMKDLNDRALALKRTQSYRTGGTEYTPEIAAGILKKEEENGLARLSEIDANMQVAIAQASSAKNTNDFALLEKRMNTIDDLKKAKETQIQNIYKAYADNQKYIADTKKAMDAEERAVQTSALADLKVKAPQLLKEFDSLGPNDQKTYITLMSKKTGLDEQTILGQIESARSDANKDALSQKNTESIIADRNKPKEPTKPTEAEKTRTKNDDIANIILEFQDKIKTNNWAGIDPTAYEYYKKQIRATYGASAVLEFDKAIKDAKLTVDVFGDNEGGNL